jgi:hypothetical protein
MSLSEEMNRTRPRNSKAKFLYEPHFVSHTPFAARAATDRTLHFLDSAVACRNRRCCSTLKTILTRESVFGSVYFPGVFLSVVIILAVMSYCTCSLLVAEESTEFRAFGINKEYRVCYVFSLQTGCKTGMGFVLKKQCH